MRERFCFKVGVACCGAVGGWMKRAFSVSHSVK